MYLLRIQSREPKVADKSRAYLDYLRSKGRRVYLSVEKYFKQAELVEEATKASAISQIVHVYKRTDYNEALSLGLKSYEESGSQTSIEIFIDKLFYEKLYRSYERLPQREKSHARFYASLENDSFVLLTLLRGKILNYDPNWLRLAVPPNSFNLNKREVEAIVSALNFEAAYKLVLDSYYGKYFERASTPEETVANAERAFRRDLLRHAKASAIEEIFNIGSTLGFITLKEAEVHNLTALALGVEASMTPEAIRSQLFL